MHLENRIVLKSFSDDLAVLCYNGSRFMRNFRFSGIAGRPLEKWCVRLDSTGRA